MVRPMRAWSPVSRPNALRFEAIERIVADGGAAARRVGQGARRTPRQSAIIARSMAQIQTVSHIYPLGSRIDEHGHLEIWGCDVIVPWAGPEMMRMARGSPSASKSFPPTGTDAEP